MKTAGEIKTALGMCMAGAECKFCPYTFSECIENYLEKDALQYIAQLEAELEAVKRERDAAVSDLNRARNCLTCVVNGDMKDENAPALRLLCHPCHYAWRGPCKENGGAEDG